MAFHSLRGMDLFKNFLYEAAGCRPNWASVSIINILWTHLDQP